MRHPCFFILAAWFFLSGLSLHADLKAPRCKATEGSCADFVLVTWKMTHKAVGGYELRRGTSSDFAAATTILKTMALYHQDTTAVVGVEYYYWVGAIDKDGEVFFLPEKFAIGYRQGLASLKLQAEESGNYINLGMPRRLVVKSNGVRVLPRTLKVSRGKKRASLERWPGLDGEGYCATIRGEAIGKVKVKTKYAGRSRTRTFHVIDLQLIPDRLEAEIGEEIHFYVTRNGKLCQPDKMRRLEGEGEGVKYKKLKDGGLCGHIVPNAAGNLVVAASYKGAIATTTITILPEDIPPEDIEDGEEDGGDGGQEGQDGEDSGETE